MIYFIQVRRGLRKVKPRKMNKKILILILILCAHSESSAVNIKFEDKYNPSEYLAGKCTSEQFKSLKSDLQTQNYKAPANLYLAFCSALDGDISALDYLNAMGNHFILIESLGNKDDKKFIFEGLAVLAPIIIDSLSFNEDADELMDFIKQHVDEWTLIADKYDFWDVFIFKLYMYGEISRMNGDLDTANILFQNAEDMIISNGLENSSSEFSDMPIFLRIKLSKILTLYLKDNIESLLVEARSLILLLDEHDGFFPESTHLHIYEVLEIFWTRDSRIMQFEILTELEESLLASIIKDPNIEIKNEILEHTAAFFLFRSQDKIDTRFCNNKDIYNLMHHANADEALKQYISYVCEPSLEKLEIIALKLNASFKNKIFQIQMDDLVQCVSEANSECLLSLDTINQDALWGMIVMMTDNASFLELDIDIVNSTIELIDSLHENLLPSINKEKLVNITNISSFVNLLRMTINSNASPEDTLNLIIDTEINFPTLDEINSFLLSGGSLEETLALNRDLIYGFSSAFYFSEPFTVKNSLSDRQTDEYSKFLLNVRDFHINLSEVIIFNSHDNIFVDRIPSDFIQSTIKELMHTALDVSHAYARINDRIQPSDHENFLKRFLDILIFSEEIPISQSIKLSFLESTTFNKNDLAIINEYKKLFIKDIQLSHQTIASSKLYAEDLQNLTKERNSLKNHIIIAKRDLNNMLAAHDKKNFFHDISSIQSKLKDDEAIAYLVSTNSGNNYFIIILNKWIYSSYLNAFDYKYGDLDYLEDPFKDIVNLYADMDGNEKNFQIDQFSETFFTRIGTIFEKNWAEHLNLDWASSLQVKKYYFLQDGPFKKLPFHALKYRGKYLIEQFEVSYIPSLSSFIYLEPFLKPTKFVGFGNPTLTNKISSLFKKRGIDSIKSVSDLAPLQETEEEINFIANLFPESEKYLGNASTELNFKSNKRKYANSFVYFATHSVPFGSRLSDEPGLVMSQNQNLASTSHDSILTTSEIASKDFSNSLIGLSACKSFDAGYQGADEFSGLAQAFFLGGANNVYSTMWEIESNSAVIFNKAIFNYISNESLNISQALQRTSQDFINGDYGELYRDPYFWAPYLNLGL